MADFSHLRKLEVDQNSEAEFVFEDIQGEPSIWFAPMTDANTKYLNERVRLSTERAEAQMKETRAQRRKRILSAEQLEEDRDLDRVIMASTCALRWGTPPKDAKGKDVEFSEENCLDFFRAIPSYMMDPCRGFVSNVYNFVDPGALHPVTEAAGDALGNSSPTG